MKNFKKIAKEFIIKYGTSIAAVAFAFVTISSNTPCCVMYYEAKEPQGLSGNSVYSLTNVANNIVR